MTNFPPIIELDVSVSLFYRFVIASPTTEETFTFLISFFLFLLSLSCNVVKVLNCEICLKSVV